MAPGLRAAGGTVRDEEAPAAPERSERGVGRVGQAAAAHASMSGPLTAPPGPLRGRAAVPCPLGLAAVFSAVLPDCVGGCLQLYVMSLDFLIISRASV